jgi:hypothetical protein
MGATQTLRTPSRGASQESHWPSGLICPWVLVGLPKNDARGISSTYASVGSAKSATAAARPAGKSLRNDMENLPLRELRCT